MTFDQMKARFAELNWREPSSTEIAFMQLVTEAIEDLQRQVVNINANHLRTSHQRKSTFGPDAQQGDP